MNNFLLLFLLLYLIACKTQSPQVDAESILPAAPQEGRIGVDSTKVDYASTAFIAVDRQCGSCHHGDRSTNAGALAIFNLKDECWYCKLTHEQCESLRGRISGSSFSDEEREAIVALIAHLSEENENATN